MFQPRIHAASNRLARLVFRLALFCILLFTVSILLVHSQGVGDSDIGIVLLPSADCSAPCFMGVRPGTMTLAAGLAQLRASPLIQSISLASSSLDSPSPSGVYDVEFVPTMGSLRGAKVQFSTQANSGIIDGISLLDTGLRLRDIALTFGQPALLILDDRFHVGLATYVAFYPQYQIYVQTVLAVCSPDINTRWNERQDLVVGIETPQKYSEQRSYYPTSASSSGAGWAQQLYALKRTNCV